MTHLLDRLHQRHISVDQLVLFSDWCLLEPEVPADEWFNRFPGLIACCEGELVKTFLVPRPATRGQEVR